MSDADDNWPKHHKGEEKTHLHALGVISLEYNGFESSLFFLYSHHLLLRGVPMDLCWSLYSNYPDNKKSIVIRELWSKLETDHQIRERVSSILDYFNVCTANRNTLMHSTHNVTGPELDLSKWVVGDFDRLQSINLDLKRLRRVADEIRTGMESVFNLEMYLLRRDGVWLMPQLDPAFSKIFPDTLPEKLDPPRTLEMHQSDRPPTEPSVQPDASRP